MKKINKPVYAVALETPIWGDCCPGKDVAGKVMGWSFVIRPFHFFSVFRPTD